MDKGREVFRQADAFLQIAASAKNPIIPQAKESKEVSYNLMISDILKRSLKGGLVEFEMPLFCDIAQVMDIGGLLVQITHIQALFDNNISTNCLSE